jgi:predicted deacylase
MQVNHQTPIEGFFEPAVRLGQDVSAGGFLGTVCDVWGESISEIRAKYGGLVIVLHTFARVNAGDGVVVILPRDLMRRLLGNDITDEKECQ